MKMLFTVILMLILTIFLLHQEEVCGDDVAVPVDLGPDADALDVHEEDSAESVPDEYYY